MPSFARNMHHPEQGQIVSVRQRRFVVTAVQKSTLPPAMLSRQPQRPARVGCAAGACRTRHGDDLHRTHHQ